MHLCLCIPEIIRMIYDEIFAENAKLSTLCPLAHVCRSWGGVTLDRIWYQINGIKPLIQSLPHDLWSIEEDGNGMLTLARTMKDSDLDILHKYTPRVHVFIHESKRLINIGVYKTLLLLHPHVPLLPNLQSLAWLSPCIIEVYPCTTLFLCSELEFLGLRITMEQMNEQSALLLNIPNYSPSISSLKVDLAEPEGQSMWPEASEVGGGSAEFLGNGVDCANCRLAILRSKVSSPLLHCPTSTH